jgi:hypothetical protein
VANLASCSSGIAQRASGQGHEHVLECAWWVVSWEKVAPWIRRAFSSAGIVRCTSRTVRLVRQIGDRDADGRRCASSSRRARCSRRFRYHVDVAAAAGAAALAWVFSRWAGVASGLFASVAPGCATHVTAPTPPSESRR